MDCNSDLIVSKDDKSTDWKTSVKREVFVFLRVSCRLKN